MTSGLRSLLEGAHLTGPEMFVREVTQNSVDAQSSRSPVKMRFSSYGLTPSQCTVLRNLLMADGSIERRLSGIVGREQFAEDGGFFARPPFSGESTRVLLVEDFETKGLGGVVGGDGPDDHFSRLVYFFGQSHEEGATGGAFGFGKSVYSVASDVRTVIYYSRPEGDVPSRLIAVSLLPGHEHDGRKFTGYALCGVANGNESFPIVPVEGELADTIAAGLGMQRRQPDEHGTSLMIVDCMYEAEELRSALEKWWWPRLVTTGADGLVVEMFQDGKRLLEPSPAARPDLEDFVRVYQHLLDGREDLPDTKSKLLKSTHQKLVGRIALRRVDLTSDSDDDEAWYTHTIAMFRGPKLVVQYAPLGKQHMTPFVGVFVADDAMDPVFRRSENPAHDTWAPESNRLEEVERAYVRAVEKYAKQFARDFQASFEAKPLAPTSRLRALEDLLGRMFAKGRSPGPVPRGADRPVSLSVQERRDTNRGFDEARIEVRPRVAVDVIAARIQVSAHLLGDAHRGHLESLEVELLDDDGRRISIGRQVECPFDVVPDGIARFVARTRSPIDSLVKFSVTVSGRSA